MHADLLLRTKLTPPRLHRRMLPRPALAARLPEAPPAPEGCEPGPVCDPLDGGCPAMGGS